MRGFTSDLIPAETLSAIFEMAQKSPSNCNTQPWLTYVASGEKCRTLSDQICELAKSGKGMEPAFGYFQTPENPYRKRQVECAVELYGNMGIARDDKMGRMMAMLRNYEFFDAPHVAFIGMPKGFGVINALDVGIYLQTLMLAMTAHGVSSCAQGALAYYPGPVREAFGFGDEVSLVAGISFGYEDVSVPANKTRTTREDLAVSASFID